MNVFIIGTPLETAKILDKRRLNKQIIECKQILKALSGESKAWVNHPATIQYRGHEKWLEDYTYCLMWYDLGDIEKAEACSKLCDTRKPDFHIEEYFIQMKRRLYTKNKEFYKAFANLGESEINWYFVNGCWKFYKSGKTIKENL